MYQDSYLGLIEVKESFFQTFTLTKPKQMLHS